jgi:hypothetical protein
MCVCENPTSVNKKKRTMLAAYLAALFANADNHKKGYAI